MRVAQDAERGPHTHMYRVQPLSARYCLSWRATFDERFPVVLQPGVAILDMGTGRTPCLPPTNRPEGCTYVGIDPSAQELDAVPAGSYNEVLCSGIETHHPDLDDRFDLVFGWRVLAHVMSLTDSLANIRRPLRLGGTFLAHLSGRYALTSILNFVIRRRPALWAMEKLLTRPPQSVFPAPDDRYSHTALIRRGREWSAFDVAPRYSNVVYSNFSRPLQTAYRAFENVIESRCFDNLAPYYLFADVR